MKKILVLFVGLSLLMSACGTSNNKHYNPYSVEEGEEAANIYKGDNQELHINTWYPSEEGSFDIEENFDTHEVKVKYRKAVGGYTHIYTTTSGPLADFTYINIKAKGTPGKSIAMRMCYDPSDLENTNVLGNDVSFSLTEDYSIHSLKVKGVYKTRLDLVKRVCIFPEIGTAGSDVRDTFTISDCWFSKEIPDGGRWENTGVDSGDTSATINGWKAQAWTGYTLYPVGKEAGISYKLAADWAYVEKDVEIKENENVLNFSFKNIKKTLSDELSVSHMHIKLVGDELYFEDEGVEYGYPVYAEEIVYTYDPINKTDEVKPDDNGNINLKIPLGTALNRIGPSHKNGYRIALVIESDPDAAKKSFETERDGKLEVQSISFEHSDEVTFEKYSQGYSTTYKLKDKLGVDKNITYTGIKGDSYYPRLIRHVDSKPGQDIVLTLHNNGEEDVLIVVHAGIYKDARSNKTDNNFFPLYQNRGTIAVTIDGKEREIYEDGETVIVEAGENKVVNITVDDSSTYGVDKKNDAINCIEMLIDNCYGDTAYRSGDIDVVSVEVNK